MAGILIIFHHHCISGTFNSAWRIVITQKNNCWMNKNIRKQMTLPILLGEDKTPYPLQLEEIWNGSTPVGILR